jgi:hypothetical protein
LYQEKIKYFDSIESVKEWIEKGNVAKVNWCGKKECFEKIKELGPSIEPIGFLYDEIKSGVCIVCNQTTDKLTLVGKTY